MTFRSRVFRQTVFIFTILLLARTGHSTAAGAQLTLTWTDNSTNESGFAIERKTGTTGTFTQVAQVIANSTTYTDANLAAGTSYCYRVRAFNATTYSGYSNESCGTTALQSFTLTVSKGGTGSGTVHSSPAGINCGTDCSAPYPSGTTVTLTATPAAGSTFSGWSSGSCGSNTTCTVNLTSNVAITASFITITSPKLVAAYSFDEGSGTTVTDISGNNNTGTISEAVWTTQGKFGSALSFNGATSLVRVDDTDSLDLTNGMTLEAWVYPTATPSGWRTLIVKEYVYVLYASAGSYANKPLTWISNNTHTYGGTTLAANTWTHVAATYDGVTIRLYINGTEVASRAYSGQIPLSSNPLWIGGNGLYGEYFQGIIDEVRIYNQALTASQIQEDMNTPLGTTTTSPPQTYTLTVGKEGTGSGTVHSSPAGISCGTDCSAPYPSGTTVTLTATPAAGSTFSGWSGACTGSGTCTLTMTANTSVTATFKSTTLVFAANAGGPQYSAPNGTVYLADTAFSGGRTSVSSNDIAKTDADPLYQSDRLGTFSYAIPVPNGTYNVTLHFAETYWRAPKKRVFNVTAEGKEVVSKLDIYAKVGKNTAYNVTVAVTVQDGTLNLGFFPLIGEAKVNAIQVTVGSNTTTTLKKRGNKITGGSSAYTQAANAASSFHPTGAQIGTFRSSTGLWRLDLNNNGIWDGCTEDACAGPFGASGDLPVVGSWIDGGNATLGVFKPSTGTWQFDRNGNGLFDGCQVDRCLGPFGQVGDLPLVGDWTGSGTARIGVYDPKTALVELDLNGNGLFDGCQVDRCLGPFGQPGDVPVVADWTGTGATKIGVFDPKTGLWELDLNGNGLFDGCQVDRCLGPFGQVGDLPLVGK